MLFSLLLCSWCSEILNSAVERCDAHFLVIMGDSWYYRLQGEGLSRRRFMWLAFRRGRWGPYGEGGEKQGEVLMGKRQMACQCQKWSCAEKSAGANEREDGRKGWLINLFTSLKTLQAPFWLKFRLPSIITNAGSGHRSCQHQTLWNPPPPFLLSSHYTPGNRAKHFWLGILPHMHLYLLSVLCCRASGSL